MVDENSWPPEQPTSFTPLLLIHSKGNRTIEEVTTMAKLMHAGDISKVVSPTSDHPAAKHVRLDSHEKYQKVLDTSKATKEIEIILAPLAKSKEASFILIEGAPGIGKSMLLKEIAYRWGEQQLLQKYELVLLVCLRDPFLCQVESVDDLLQLFCIGDKNATKIVSACAEYLLDNGGKNLVFLLDGYDEYPEHLRESSLVANILKRRLLPCCGLVVSSRPHASGHFHKRATIRVDILGFTETEQENYIKQAFPDQPYRIEELTQYLHKHSFVDSICFIPFNMAILLYLYKLEKPLPKNSTELYFNFICSTISRHLTKLGNSLVHDITDLTDLPEPYNRIIQQLSKLSLEALNKNKLIFTFEEITAACPDIEATPGAINGLGLLQVVQHFGRYTKKVTVNFIHFTIQEFLAAHYISHLPPNEELQLIKENFWSDIHFNMFSIYKTLTKGQQPAFKKFLSGGNKAIAISPEFLEDRLQCLHLYHCFNEANDQRMCNAIEQAEIFRHKKIYLDTTLSTSDIECVSLFLTSSFNKEWKELSLSHCYIQDKGLNILYHGLQHSSDITINQLWLYNNGLTAKSSSLISELAVKCKVEVLWISGNDTIGEDQQLYSILTNPFNVLEKLNMWHTGLSSTAAIALFTALKVNNKLKELYISRNAITDDALGAITTALESNSCLVKLSMYDNPLSNEAMINIVRSLEVNNTLQLLGLPDCPGSIQENLLSLQEVVNEKRESREYLVTLKIKFNLVYYYE